jgi:phage shock protein PspC (stress-responsive transcriptional regulator)
MSVLATVLAVVIALGWSISAAFWSGVACYAVAALCLQERSQADLPS